MIGCPHCGKPVDIPRQEPPLCWHKIVADLHVASAVRLQTALDVAEHMALFNADKRVAQAVERAINLTVRGCENVCGDDSIMRHVDTNKIAALAMGGGRPMSDKCPSCESTCREPVMVIPSYKTYPTQYCADAFHNIPVCPTCGVKSWAMNAAFGRLCYDAFHDAPVR